VLATNQRKNEEISSTATCGGTVVVVVAASSSGVSVGGDDASANCGKVVRLAKCALICSEADGIAEAAVAATVVSLRGLDKKVGSDEYNGVLLDNDLVVDAGGDEVISVCDLELVDKG
jgi:hypothetical protein